MEHTTSTPNNELAHAPNHPQDRHTPMDTNELYALFNGTTHPQQATPDTYGGYMCEPCPEDHCVMLLDIDCGAMGGVSLYVSEGPVLDARIEFEADSPDTSPADLEEWFACLDRMRTDLRNAYEWASNLLATVQDGEA